MKKTESEPSFLFTWIDMAIHFFSEDIAFNFPKKRIRKQWLKKIAQEKGFHIRELNYIFCSDAYLHKINLHYLNHDTLTDIITFDNSEEKGPIEGDVFISVERVKDNALTMNCPIEEEFSRVTSHGLFHLMGYKDKSEKEQIRMRKLESSAIDLFKTLNVPRETGN